MRPRLLLVAVTVALTAGCGVPVSGSPEVLSTSAVPYNLLKSPTATASPSASPTTSPGPSDATAPARAGVVPVRVAFVVESRPSSQPSEQQVVLQDRYVPAGAPARMAQDLLGQLQTGPTESEHTEGLGSAIPSGTGLLAAQVSGGLLTIDVTGDFSVQAPDRLPLAIAQIVLTATSQPGVDRVLLLEDGTALSPPRPNGTLIIGKELTRRDYESLIR